MCLCISQVFMVKCEDQRLKETRRAFGDAKLSRETHDITLENFNIDIRENSALRNRSLVLSALAGLMCSAGVLGATSCGLRTDRGGGIRTALLGSVVMQAIAGGVAVAYTTGLALVFERIVYDIELNRELWEIENHLTGEIQEMVAIYMAQGLTEDDALMVTRVFAKRKTAFANLMMVEELGYPRLEPPSRREALVDAAVPAVIGYATGSLLPLIPLGWQRPTAVRVETVGLCVLAAGGVAVSFALSEVFYGSYANRKKELKIIASNLAVMGVIFGAARLASCLCWHVSW